MADTAALQAPREQQQPAREQDPQPKPKQKLMSMAYIRRHPDMTPDQFYEHWEHTHGVIVKPWAQKHGMVYTQVHLRRQYRDGAQAIGPEKIPAGGVDAAGAGAAAIAAVAPLDDYDGCALFEIDSFEQFSAAFEDEYYKTIIEPDERRFIDKQVGVMRIRGEVRKITI